MKGKLYEWDFLKRTAKIRKWVADYDACHLSELNQKLADQGPAKPPSLYASSLFGKSIDLAAVGALSVVDTHAKNGWDTLHLAWRPAALLNSVQIQHREHRINEYHRNREAIPTNFPKISALDLNLGSLAWCEAVLFQENGYIRQWGDRIVKAISSNEPLVSPDIFASFGGAPFEYFVVTMHARWQKLPLQYAGKIPKDWPVYAKVLDTWDGPLSKFRNAVHGICDYHCDHCWDYADSLHEAFNPIPFAIFPVEILALKNVRESMGLPFPELDHKLVNDNPLFHPPDPIPKAVATDEWEIKTIARMREIFPQLKLPFDELPLDPSLSRTAAKPKKAAKKTAAKSQPAKKAVKKHKPK